VFMGMAVFVTVRLSAVLVGMLVRVSMGVSLDLCFAFAATANCTHDAFSCLFR